MVFTDTACYVKYNGKFILSGTKDPSTVLWVLPLTPKAINDSQRQLWTSQRDGDVQNITNLQNITNMPNITDVQNNTPTLQELASVAMFTHSVRTRANTVKFGHQAMCNPKIFSLLKALQKGFLKGCPNLSEDLVTIYLNPSPATAKGHMKRPKKGIRSTSKKSKTKDDDVQHLPVPIPQVVPPILQQYIKEP